MWLPLSRSYPVDRLLVSGVTDHLLDSNASSRRVSTQRPFFGQDFISLSDLVADHAQSILVLAHCEVVDERGRDELRAQTSEGEHRNSGGLPRVDDC